MSAPTSDFLDEVIKLRSVLVGLSDGGWKQVTQFKGWTINDVILHLYASDYAAIAAVRGADEFRALREDMLRIRESESLTMIEESRKRFPRFFATELLEAWTEQARRLCQLLDQRPGGERIPWSGPSMSVRSFVTARQMETWAHGQEVYDVLGVERTNSDSLKNIAYLGVMTFGWSFSNRKLDVPEMPPVVELVAPSGELWVWNDDLEAEDRISGPATDFCQVVTQVRSIEDVNLKVAGKTAARWMQIAQCFAGPPQDPPQPATRFRQSVRR